MSLVAIKKCFCYKVSLVKVMFAYAMANLSLLVFVVLFLPLASVLLLPLMHHLLLLLEVLLLVLFPLLALVVPVQ